MKDSDLSLEVELPKAILTKRYYEANLEMLDTENDILGSLLDIIK